MERSSGTIRNDIPVTPESPVTAGAGRRPRADAQRNAEALLDAAKAVFLTSGVDAPPKQIADAAGVGVGTLYRHFPQRSDLVVAVFRREIDACADAAATLAAENPPGLALERWLYRLTEFIAAKRGLASALHGGDVAFDDLRTYFMARFGTALDGLLAAAIASGEVRAVISTEELLSTVARLCQPMLDEPSVEQSRRMVAILVNGLRYDPDTQAS